MYKTAFLLLLPFILFACKEKPQNVVKDEILPILPQDTFMRLFNECDNIDFIFYTRSFSMSYDNKPAIQTSLSWIGSTSAPSSFTCNPEARVIFQNKGTDMIEADMYFSDGCAFFVWLENQNPVYSNMLTDAGIAQYSNILSKTGN